MLGIHTPALPASLRRTNERTVMSLLLRLGSASRAELAKAAGISQPTAGKIITRLLKLGVVQLAEESDAERVGGPVKLGRPGERVRLAATRPRFIAIELGVAETRATALPVAFPTRDEWTFRFPTPSGPETWAGKLAELDLPRGGIWGVLVSVPGIVDETAGKVLFSPNLHWTERASLPDLLKEFWRAPVLLVQEIRALALGHLALEPGTEDFLLVDFGQGVGGAVVSGGKLHSHALPACGEVGHTPVPGNQRKCGCGAVGCLETLISERGLLTSFREEERQEATLEALGAHIRRHGLPGWLRRSLAATAGILAGALNVLGIRQVLVTGYLDDLPAPVLEFLAREIQRGALWARFGEVICRSVPRRRAAGLTACGFDRLVLPSHTQTARRTPELVRRDAA
jgi:predicted NBD/HSP70 family sugar kinase